MIAVALLFSYSCKRAEVSKKEQAGINVVVKPAIKMRLSPTIETTGSIECYDRVRLAPEIDGIIRAVYVDEGSVVRKSKVLAVIDEKDIRLEVERAEAALEQAEASLANTKQEYERKKALYSEGLITAQQFDDITARLSIAEAELKRARSALSTSRQRLAKTSIISPIDGVVERRSISPGDYVRTAQEAFSVITINPIKIEFTIPEKEISFVKVGQEISFTVDSYPTKEFKGKVRIIYPSLDVASRTIRVEAEGKNPNNELKPGMFAHVKVFKGSPRDVVLVPSTSLLFEGKEVRAFVIKGDKAQERRPKIGASVILPEGEFTEIIEGIDEAEDVVSIGHQNLYEGAKVSVAR